VCQDGLRAARFTPGGLLVFKHDPTQESAKRYQYPNDQNPIQKLHPVNIHELLRSTVLLVAAINQKTVEQ
jgi:hypothetical protein